MVERECPIADWLLLPGWGFGPSVFDELRAALPTGLRVEAVACREAAAAIDRRVAAVTAGAAAPFGICAWSLGATVAITRASVDAGAIAAMVLAGATPRFVAGDDRLSGMPMADFDTFRALAATSLPTAQSRLASLSAMGSADAPTLLRRLRRSFDRPGPGEAASAFRADLLAGLDCLREADLYEVLHGLGMPVAVVHGLQDALVPVQAARALTGALSGAQWLPVAGGGHALPVVHAALLAATIEALATAERHPSPEPLPSP